jgi:hypothetical protein
MRVDLKTRPHQVTITGTELRAHIWAMVQYRGVTDLADGFELNIEIGDSWVIPLQPKQQGDSNDPVRPEGVAVSVSDSAGVLDMPATGGAQ